MFRLYFRDDESAFADRSNILLLVHSVFEDVCLFVLLAFRDTQPKIECLEDDFKSLQVDQKRRLFRNQRAVSPDSSSVILGRKTSNGTECEVHISSKRSMKVMQEAISWKLRVEEKSYER